MNSAAPFFFRPFRLPASSDLIPRGPVAKTIAATLLLAAVAASVVLVAAGWSVEWSAFERFVALAAGMLLVAGWSRARRLDPRLADAAALVATGTLALMLCGIISNAGLRLGAPLIDPQLVAMDAAFGIEVEQAVRGMAGVPALIDGLGAIYNASGLAVVVLLACTLVAGQRAKAWEVAVTCFVSMQIVAVLSIIFPAIGAMEHLGMQDLQGAGLPQGAGVYHLESFAHFRDGAGTTLRLTDLNGLVTFPSFHTVLALLALQAVADTRWRWLGVAWTAAVIVSTIPIGGHYVTDLAAGFAVWLGAALLARRVSSPSA